MNRIVILAGAAVLLATAAAPAAAQERLEGVRFFPSRAEIYGPARELGEALGLQVSWRSGSLYLEGEKVLQADQEVLPDESAVLKLRSIPGAEVTWNADSGAAEVHLNGRSVVVADRVSVTDGISFAADGDGSLYAPAREVGAALNLSVQWNPAAETAEMGGRELDGEGVRILPDGNTVVAAPHLETWGAAVSREPAGTRVRLDERTLWMRRADQRVAISLDAQRLRAWQGRRLVLDTNVSTGKSGHSTPQGLYRAGPLKAPLMISRKYGNARMPWSVQVQGDVLIHGFPSVPPRAASHGCIRMPLTGPNPARWFYSWVQVGTPIHIAPGWPEEWPVDMARAR